ncbi:MAG: flagellar hook-basal body complex protein FliE, partial [Phycisphaerales bacterium]|nr:flagellar hook-basal body complex protein FliE [Phycisphaerales bacterium]
LKAEMARVNELQEAAQVAAEDFAAGRRDDVESVLFAARKADTAFKMLLQVRNKMLEAYEEVKQLRI